MEQPDRNRQAFATIRELRESVLLLALAAASVGAYIAVGIVTVRLFAR